jgi:hypothetical protein
VLRDFFNAHRASDWSLYTYGTKLVGSEELRSTLQRQDYGAEETEVFAEGCIGQVREYQSVGSIRSDFLFGFYFFIAGNMRLHLIGTFKEGVKAVKDLDSVHRGVMELISKRMRFVFKNALPIKKVCLCLSLWKYIGLV